MPVVVVVLAIVISQFFLSLNLSTSVSLFSRGRKLKPTKMQSIITKSKSNHSRKRRNCDPFLSHLHSSNSAAACVSLSGSVGHFVALVSMGNIRLCVKQESLANHHVQATEKIVTWAQWKRRQRIVRLPDPALVNASRVLLSVCKLSRWRTQFSHRQTVTAPHSVWLKCTWHAVAFISRLTTH